MNMSRGNFQRPGKKNKKPIILILSLVLLLAAVGGTAAFLKAASNSVTNTFVPGEVEITPGEKKTDTTKSDITFTNSGSVPVYVRATLVIYWTDRFDVTDDGVDNPTEQIIPMPAGAAITDGAVQTGWFQIGDIYYFAEPVAPGEKTSVMLDTITVTLPDGSTAQCHIDVQAEAIQAEPTSMVTEAWNDVIVVGGLLEDKQKVVENQ